MSTPYVPSPGDHARRRLFTRALTYGSEDGFTPVSRDTAAEPIDSRHESPEPRGVIVLTDNLHSSPATSGTDPAAGDADKSSTENGIHPRRWTTPQLVSFLEACKVPEASIKELMSAEIDGAAFLEIIADPEAHKIMEEELHISKKMMRLAIMGKIKGMVADCDMAQANPKQTTAGNKSGSTLMVAGEKGIKVPVMPKPLTGEKLCSALAWKAYITAVKSWAELTSHDYAWTVMQVYRNPNLDVKAAYNLLSENEQRMDTVWGISIMSESPDQVKALFVKSSDYELNETTSGLQMAAFLGKKISKICSTRYLTLSNSLTQREALTNPHKLEEELEAINRITDQLEHQGEPVSDNELYRVLYKAVQHIQLYSDMTTVLAIPITDCRKQHGTSGSKLMEVLTEQAWEINNNPLYKQKAKTVGGVGLPEPRPKGNSGPALPKFHRPQTAGKGCTNERELGECMMKDKGCVGIHDKGQWSGKECDKGCYQQFGLCNEFYKGCLNKHSKKLSREELFRQKGLAMRAGYSFGVEKLTCNLCDLSGDNIIQGTRRRTANPRYVSANIESAEEEAELLEANSDSDPAGTSSSGNEDKEDSQSPVRIWQASWELIQVGARTLLKVELNERKSAVSQWDSPQPGRGFGRHKEKNIHVTTRLT